MTVDSFLPALSAVLYALFLIVSVYIYASLMRQIAVRSPDFAEVPRRDFGLPEAVLATFLALFFLLTLAGSSPRDVQRIDDDHLIASTAIIIGLVLALAAFLRLRRFDLDSLGGFSKIGFLRTAITAGVLIFFAYPIILLADIVTQRLLRSPPEQQAIVEMFNGSGTLKQRVLIIFLAVTVAPVAEEFIFRFFLYGVAKRYFGKVAAVIVSALLFAAVHGHLPSFGPLLVLGTCLAIAYEWSGSILVPMTMHTLFNAVTLTVLAFPNKFQP
jgi:membrane protease YdiL (CAAX protease family)